VRSMPRARRRGALARGGMFAAACRVSAAAVVRANECEPVHIAGVEYTLVVCRRGTLLRCGCTVYEVLRLRYGMFMRVGLKRCRVANACRNGKHNPSEFRTSDAACDSKYPKRR